VRDLLRLGQTTRCKLEDCHYTIEIRSIAKRTVGNRMLIAQAQVEGMTIVTSEACAPPSGSRLFEFYKVEVLWNN
jgi:hypothetical protein